MQNLMQNPIRKFALSTALGAGLLAGLTAPAAADDSVPAKDDLANLRTAALAPYYAALRQEIELPVAPTSAAISDDALITRLAFGSCNNQNRSQHMWAQIAAFDPQLFLLIGDNNYGDKGWRGDLGLESLRQAYAKQAATPELTEFRAKIPMMAAWDDHDFGFNDAGASFGPRQWSETLFETFWGASDEARSRAGIYDSRIFGPEGKRVQVILLDTRYFRSELEKMDTSGERPPLGPYVPSDDPAKTMLGAEQWEWLEGELAKPADLRIIASSIQVLTDAHNYESWENLPLERAKLFAMLTEREESGLVLLSGDRHAGGIYTDTPEAAGGERMWELTSSSLNMAFNDTASNTAREPDPKRVTDFISEENFGMVEIDWDKGTFTLSMRGNQGEERVSRSVVWR